MPDTTFNFHLKFGYVRYDGGLLQVTRYKEGWNFKYKDEDMLRQGAFSSYRRRSDTSVVRLWRRRNSLWL